MDIDNLNNDDFLNKELVKEEMVLFKNNLKTFQNELDKWSTEKDSENKEYNFFVCDNFSSMKLCESLKENIGEIRKSIDDNITNDSYFNSLNY